MKFFFPDSQDMVDPRFEFEEETRAEFRLRQRDDRYAHEVFASPPFDGILVSKAIVDGCLAKPGKYTFAQRYRLRRQGIRAFLRLDQRDSGRRIETLGDCGAFSYVEEEHPPFTVEEVLNFYADCGFDYGISVDHAILAYDPKLDQLQSAPDDAVGEYVRRQEITLHLAERFFTEHGSRGDTFVPVGVAQGWSPASYARAVQQLQRIGYRTIALGGMVPLKTGDILESLTAVNSIRRSDTRLHLLGITRLEHMDRFEELGVTSFDSTSPFRQAFKDAKANYHTVETTYVALRVPQVDKNPKLYRRILAGEVDQQTALKLERECLRLLREYDAERVAVSEVLEALAAYEVLYDGRVKKGQAYRRTLEAAPWKSCGCEFCREIGIDVAIFRGTERNKRRGFHNMYVFYQKLVGRALAGRGGYVTAGGGVA